MILNTRLKYLDNFGEIEVPKGLFRTIFFPKPQERYSHCAIIPLYGEPLWVENGLPSLIKAAEATGQKTLVIGVINRHELSPISIQEENRETLNFINRFKSLSIPDFPLMTLYELSPKTDLLILNHNEEPNLFSSKEGVGKARKLGCDLALALTTTPILNCNYLHTTDGDAVVDLDYFQIEKSSEAAVLLHPYSHFGVYKQSEALTLYEFSLRYYVEGLKYANSPYAHESLGSTIAVTPDCYAKVRGFPKRNAAEDFYFLNKAAKVGTIEQASLGWVKLKGRESDRVPFGTGVGTDKIWQKMEQQQPVTFYDPKSFLVVKNLNLAIKSWSEDKEMVPDASKITRAICLSTSTNDLERMQILLRSLSFFEILETAKAQRKSPEAVFKHCHESWDGFKTLKFIHGLRDNFFPEVKWEEAKISNLP
jgi:hypothetical protein